MKCIAYQLVLDYVRRTGCDTLPFDLNFCDNPTTTYSCNMPSFKVFCSNSVSFDFKCARLFHGGVHVTGHRTHNTGGGALRCTGWPCRLMLSVKEA